MARKNSELILVRMPLDQKKALIRAGEDEGIPPSTLMRVIALDWLRRREYLPKKSRGKGGE